MPVDLPAQHDIVPVRLQCRLDVEGFALVDDFAESPLAAGMMIPAVEPEFELLEPRLHVGDVLDPTQTLPQVPCPIDPAA